MWVPNTIVKRATEELHTTQHLAAPPSLLEAAGLSFLHVKYPGADYHQQPFKIRVCSVAQKQHCNALRLIMLGNASL